MPSSRDIGPGRARRMSVAGAVVDGWRRVLRAPALAFGILAITLLLALPLAGALGPMNEEHLGWGLAAADGIGRTFTHEFVGFGGTIAILSGLLDREHPDPALAAILVTYLALWLFLWGGILDRLARDRRVGAAAFFSACGTWFFRFLRLAVPLAAAWWVLFGVVHPWLFGGVYDRLTHDLTDERTIAAIRLGLYLVVGVVMLVIHLAADFAHVRAIVEDRRSMLGSILAGLRFARRRPARVLGLYAANGVALALVVVCWRLVAPGAEAPASLAFVMAQVYLLLRIWTRLALVASALSFFQAELAHAGYTAALPVWPDSPAVETIDRPGR